MPPLPVPDELIEACARGLLARTRARFEDAALRADDLRRRAQAAAEVLRDRHRVRRVWLFGSLAGGTPHPGSDVDLLVDGLKSEDWSAAVASVEEVVQVAVDLVRIEDAPAALIERVRADGVLLVEPR